MPVKKGDLAAKRFPNPDLLLSQNNVPFY